VRKLKGQRGAAAVEFALIAPLLFMLIFGITEFGVAWSQREVYIQAAREGARYAAVGCEDGSCASGEVADRVDDAALDYTLTNTPAVSPDPGCSSTDSSDTVTVSWSQSFSINIPFIPPVTMSAPISAVFRCEV
jgi:Flp pilus assembly protein TadG